MGPSRRSAAATVTIAAALVISGCGSTKALMATPSSSVATPSRASPGGALAGFLAAARSQDSSHVQAWLATTNDTSDLAELLRVYADFGSSDGIFWQVPGIIVTAVAIAGAGRADVTLSGDIVWCLGKAASDPAATCSVVSPVPGMPHTYVALQVDGAWKADVDINASTGVVHNPQGSPTPSPLTATPAPT